MTDAVTPQPAAPTPTDGDGIRWPGRNLITRRRFLAALAAMSPVFLGAVPRWPKPEPAPAPAPGATAARWAFGVDVDRCIGCGRCAEACKLENGVPFNPECNRTWIERHAVAKDGTVYVDSPDGGINGFPPVSTAPGAAGQEMDRSWFLPRLCMQCENPPCVGVCPVQATYRTADGVVLVDQDRCIGCGYCVVACPYGARYLVPWGDRSPTGNAGVADKCTWCYHRITQGRQPACVEVCPVDARVFGAVDDETSPIQAFLDDPDVTVMRQDLGTRPRVLYRGLPAEVG